MSVQDVESFFHEMRSAGAEDILPSNTLNFDETALSDDTGARNVIGPRGTSRVEVVKETYS